MKQSYWDALIDWCRSAVAEDGDIADHTAFSNWPDIHSAIEDVLYDIEGEWDDPNPSADAEFTLRYTPSVWKLLDDLFRDLRNDHGISRAVRPVLRQKLRDAANVLHREI